ncbi:unnamed protein product [Plutella xylostella]|uniref:(diamondback moth) hypothetical protein n=1 Tax=Plutella xylostella TaxID=51655 RepID=A0A8S4EPV2_PLUXY|nr:unnamed protein product [Plutella xylostella]
MAFRLQFQQMTPVATYLNDNMWKADLNKKPRSNAVEAAMTGSFRTLSID